VSTAAEAAVASAAARVSHLPTSVTHRHRDSPTRTARLRTFTTHRPGRSCLLGPTTTVPVRPATAEATSRRTSRGIRSTRARRRPENSISNASERTRSISTPPPPPHTHTHVTNNYFSRQTFDTFDCRMKFVFCV